MAASANPPASLPLVPGPRQSPGQQCHGNAHHSHGPSGKQSFLPKGEPAHQGEGGKAWEGSCGGGAATSLAGGLQGEVSSLLAAARSFRLVGGLLPAGTT